MRTLLLIACVTLLPGYAAALAGPGGEGSGGTVGATLLDVAPDTIGLSLRLRVDAVTRDRKIVFVGVRTATPGTPRGTGFGTIDMDVFTHWVQYQDDLGHAGWPEQGDPHPGEPSLWLRNVDYNGLGRVGIRPLGGVARRLFPRQCAGIDRVNGRRSGITSIAAIHQGSIFARDVRLTLVRQPLSTRGPELDWGFRFTWDGRVTPILPPGSYWPWLLTVETAGEPTTRLLFLLDEERGRYVVADGGVSVRTEFFFRPDAPQSLQGLLQVFLWDVQTLREGDTRWRRHWRWEYREDESRGPPAAGYGFRTVTYRGHGALEVGYGLGDYRHIGDVLDVGRRETTAIHPAS